MTATHHYLGALRTEMTHSRSGQTVLTDAPPDNNGKGEAFSPTDLVAAALVSCKMTVMGIVAERHAYPLGTLTGSVEKVMADRPRRIAALHVRLRFEGQALTPEQRAVLERTARTCPVAHSLHPDISLDVTFEYA